MGTNMSKNPWKNGVNSEVGFGIDFCSIWGRFWEGLGTPKQSQIDQQKTSKNTTSNKNDVLGGIGWFYWPRGGEGGGGEGRVVSWWDARGCLHLARPAPLLKQGAADPLARIPPAQPSTRRKQDGRCLALWIFGVNLWGVWGGHSASSRTLWASFLELWGIMLGAFGHQMEPTWHQHRSTNASKNQPRTKRRPRRTKRPNKTRRRS